MKNPANDILDCLRRRLLLIVLLLGVGGGFVSLSAQTSYHQVSLGRERLGWTSHLTWWTNLTDWALFAPNVGVDIDLRSPQRMWTQSLALLVRNGADSQSRLWHNDYDGSDLNVWGLQTQYRWHFSQHKHPEYYRSRFFAGPYLEVLSRWKSSSLGAAAGYDFPGLSFGNRHFIQFQLSGTLGMSIEPAVAGELHFGMAYRTMNIANKYWRPDAERYERNNAANKLAQEQMDTLQAKMQLEPVTILAASLYGDSALAAPVTLAMIREAFAKQYKHPNLIVGKIEEMAENTPLPLFFPGEHNNVLYRMSLQPKDYDSPEGEASYILPFRVRIVGYDEAVLRMQSFNASLRKAYESANKQLPALKLQPASRDSMAVSARMDQVLGLFGEQWKSDSLKANEVTGLYYRNDGEFVPVELSQLNKRGTYAVGIKFHPQVFESYDSLVTRFSILPDIDSRDQRMYDRFVDVYNRQTFYVSHPWHNGKEGQVTKDQVIAALDASGMNGYETSQVQLSDSIRYGRNVGTTTYGPALQPLQFIFIVEDSVGLKQGTRIYEALNAGVDARRATWSPLYESNDAHGPLVDGCYDENQQLTVADKSALLKAVSAYMANIDPDLQGLEIEEAWVEDYQSTGLHPLKPAATTPEGTQWTILQFKYRLLYVDERPRIAVANVAYRIKPPVETTGEE